MDIIKKFQAIFKQPEAPGRLLKPTPANISKCLHALAHDGRNQELVNKAAYHLATREIIINSVGAPSGFKFDLQDSYRIAADGNTVYLKYFQIDTEKGQAGFFVKTTKEHGVEYKTLATLRAKAIDFRSIKPADAEVTLVQFCKDCEEAQYKSALRLNQLESMIYDKDLDEVKRDDLNSEIAYINRNNYNRFLCASKHEKFTKKMQVVLKFEDLLPEKQTFITKILKAVGA